jgi:hypothetical protein
MKMKTGYGNDWHHCKYRLACRTNTGKYHYRYIREWGSVNGLDYRNSDTSVLNYLHKRWRENWSREYEVAYLHEKDDRAERGYKSTEVWGISGLRSVNTDATIGAKLTTDGSHIFYIVVHHNGSTKTIPLKAETNPENGIKSGYYALRVCYQYYQNRADWDKIVIRRNLPEKDLYPICIMQRGLYGFFDPHPAWVEYLKKVNI